MNKFTNIVLSTFFLLSLTLSNGYYKCNTKNVLHFFSSCCEAPQQLHTCCKPSKNSKTTIKGKCCDKLNLEAYSLTTQDSSNKDVTVKSIALIDDLYQSRKLFSLPSKHFNKPIHPPLHDGSNTYKIHCSFLC